jgi:hypothetical protein
VITTTDDDDRLNLIPSTQCNAMQCNAMENVCTVVQLNICNEKETELKASSKLNSGETKRKIL